MKHFVVSFFSCASFSLSFLSLITLKRRTRKKRATSETQGKEDQEQKERVMGGSFSSLQEWKEREVKWKNKTQVNTVSAWFYFFHFTYLLFQVLVRVLCLIQTKPCFHSISLRFVSFKHTAHKDKGMVYFVLIKTKKAMEVWSALLCFN